jgi:putative oxygen-independent coproporphyrinogen III oxidase
MSSLLKLPPLSLYIHIPWCLKKCPYCDFNSHEFKGAVPENEYIDALLMDLDQGLGYVQERTLQSIFFGGGTPSLFSAKAIQRFLEGCHQRIGFAEDIEITLEANPGTFEQQKFADFRTAGINRLSIGIQSFQEDFLSRLGRVHNASEALRAADIARKAGFDNVNLDLMFGLPSQEQEQALADLQQAIALNPSHISWYQLTLEPNTQFYRYPPALPEASLIEGMQDAGIELLAESGFQRYEISAFSQPGQRSQHNLNYWHFGDYLGIGAGAHGKLTLPAQNQIIRTRKLRQPRAYLQPHAIYCVSQSAIEQAELPLEFMMNVLRLTEGATESLFEERTGLPLSLVQKNLDDLRKQGLLLRRDIVPTAKGMDLLNNVLQAFIR